VPVVGVEVRVVEEERVVEAAEILPARQILAEAVVGAPLAVEVAETA